MSAKADLPLVSVIIPAYNQAAYIEEAVASVYDQTYANLQVIVINDGSTDSTAEVMAALSRKHPHLTCVTQENAGVCRACNAALELARGPYVIRLDADDYLPNDYVGTLLDLLERQPDHVAYAYCDAHYVGEREGLMAAAPYDFPRLVTENYIHVSALVRAEAARKVGYYNPNMVHGFEDWDLWLSMADHGYRGVYCSGTFLYYRQKKEPSRNAMRVEQHRAARAQIMANHPAIYGKAVNQARVWTWKAKRRLRRYLGVGG